MHARLPAAGGGDIPSKPPLQKRLKDQSDRCAEAAAADDAAEEVFPQPANIPTSRQRASRAAVRFFFFILCSPSKFFV